MFHVGQPILVCRPIRANERFNHCVIRAGSRGRVVELRKHTVCVLTEDGYAEVPWEYITTPTEGKS